MEITDSRARDILRWLDDQAGDHTNLFEQMTMYRDAAALIRQLRDAEQAAWHAGLDAGREQGKGNEHCRAEPQPVAWQFQDRDGKWHGFVDEQHRQNTIADGSWPMRALYAAPPSVPDRDAYEGAREDLLDWKRRAQRAEATLRGLGYKGIDASEAPSAPVGVEDKARAMFEAQADKLTAPWDRQWEPTKGFWRKRAAEALAQQPAACPKCDGTGEADSGGIYPWGAPATIPCDCQQPAAVDARIEAALKLLHPHLDTRDSRSAPVWAIEIYAALVGATLATQPGGSDNGR